MSSYLSQLASKTSYRKFVEAMANKEGNKSNNVNDIINVMDDNEGDDIIVDHVTTKTGAPPQTKYSKGRPSPDDSFQSDDNKLIANQQRKTTSSPKPASSPSSKSRRETLMSYLAKIETNDSVIPSKNDEDMYKELITHGIQEIKINQSMETPDRVQKQPMPDGSFDEFNTMNYDDVPAKNLNLLKYTNNQSDVLEASASDDILLLQQDDDDDDDELDNIFSNNKSDNDNPIRYLESISSSIDEEDDIIINNTSLLVTNGSNDDSMNNDDLLTPLSCSSRKKLITTTKQQSRPTCAFSSDDEEDEEDIFLNTANNASEKEGPLYELLTQLFSHLCQSQKSGWKTNDLGYETYHFQNNEMLFLESQYPLYSEKHNTTILDLNDLQSFEDDLLKRDDKPRGEDKTQQLQTFNLPIIYHSNQTGFEPTKDLTLQTGDVIASQYYVESTLGTAAFSTAYSCIDLYKSITQDHHKVCLKVIKNSKDFFDQSLDEIKILSLLQNDKIVKMIRYFYHREHLFIVTELLNQNLFDFSKYVNDSTYFQSLSRLKYIGYQLLLGLQYIHSLNIIHSDIKPENILLDNIEQATIKIIDFGSSCFNSDRQSSYIQSRSYRAPEVILGYLPYDGRIDIWSLGCVLAEMFTNVVTFTNHSIPTMLARMEAITGSTFEKDMIRECVHGDKYFLSSGLIYQKVIDAPDDSNDESDSTDENIKQEYYYEIYKPNMTTMSYTLGYDLDFYENHNKNRNYYINLFKQNENDVTLSEADDIFLFIDFVQFLLQKNPKNRPNATQALLHPWMVSAKYLSAEDVEYEHVVESSGSSNDSNENSSDNDSSRSDSCSEEEE